MAIEEPAYAVLKEQSGLELRKYSTLLVAETRVKAGFREAGNIGFRRLAAYIFGRNRQCQRIAMTAPVEQEPVTADEWTIAFTMPSAYDSTSLPKPNDSRVTLREIPGRTMAVVRYSGTWSHRRFRRKLATLQSWLKREGLKPAGAPIWARYNPPWTLWFLRRNEILIPVTPT